MTKMKFMSLTKDTMLKICDHLTYLDILNLLAVNKRYFKLFENSCFWTILAQRQFDSHMNNIGHKEYKRLMIEKCINESFQDNWDVYNSEGYICQKYDNMLMIEIIINESDDRWHLAYDLIHMKILWDIGHLDNFDSVYDREKAELRLIGTNDCGLIIHIVNTIDCQELFQSDYFEICEPEDTTNDERSLILSHILHNLGLLLDAETQELTHSWDHGMYYFNYSRGYLMILSNSYSEGVCFVCDDMAIYTFVCFDELWNYLNNIWDALRNYVRTKMLFNDPRFIKTMDFVHRYYELVSNNVFISSLCEVYTN